MACKLAAEDFPVRSRVKPGAAMTGARSIFEIWKQTSTRYNDSVR